MEITDYPELFEMLSIFLVVFSIYFLLYRKFLISIFDPLMIFVISMSFSCVLFAQMVTEPTHIINFIGAHLFFYFGFLWGNRPRFLHAERLPPANDWWPGDATIRRLELVVIFGFTIWLVANLVAFRQVAGILTDNPSVAKSENLQGGLGVVRRINWGFAPFLLSATCVCSVFTKFNRYFIALLVVQIFFTLLSGSKSTVLGLIATVTYLGANPYISNHKIITNARKLLPYLAILGILVMSLVLIKEKNDAEGAFFGLATRLLYFGDSVLFYYQPNTYEFFRHYNALDYISHEFNGILGFFRLVPYQKPMGFVMQYLELDPEQSVSLVVGPNTPFYIKATMFFGPLLGLIYSFFIGSTVSFFRRKLFEAKPTNLIGFSVGLTCTVFIFTLASESELFVSMLFDMIFWLGITIAFITIYRYFALHFSHPPPKPRPEVVAPQRPQQP